MSCCVSGSCPVWNCDHHVERREACFFFFQLFCCVHVCCLFRMYSSSLQLGSMPRKGLLVLYCNDIYIFWFDCIKSFLSGRSITLTQQVYARDWEIAILTYQCLRDASEK